MDIDKKIAEIGAHTPGPWIYTKGVMFKHYVSSENGDLELSLQELHWRNGREVPAEADARLIAAAPDLLNQLKECREELKTALDTANRSSKAVLKWNAEIEQRTKDAVWESINLAHAHKAHTMKRAAPLRMVEINQAIDSAEIK